MERRHCPETWTLIAASDVLPGKISYMTSTSPSIPASPRPTIGVQFDVLLSSRLGKRGGSGKAHSPIRRSNEPSGLFGFRRHETPVLRGSCGCHP